MTTAVQETGLFTKGEHPEIVNTLVLDPSIVKTGWALYHGHEMYHSGVIRTRGEGDVPRLRFLVGNVMALCAKYDARESVIEITASFSYNRSSTRGKGMNQKGLQKLNWATGALIGACSGEVYLVLVSMWKGNRGKAIDRMLAPQAKTDDEADAISLGKWWVTMGKKNELWTR